MRALLALTLAAVGAWLLLRRRAADGRRVVVAWQDGSELEFRPGSREHDRLTALAGQVLG
jgi:hypothetical protein